MNFSLHFPMHGNFQKKNQKNKMKKFFKKIKIKPWGETIFYFSNTFFQTFENCFGKKKLIFFLILK